MQEVTITAKFQILPSQKQKELLDQTMRAYVDACNFISDYVFENHVSVAEKVQKAIYRDVREKFRLKSQMAASAIRAVTSKYKAIHKKEKRWSIKPIFRRQNYELVWNRDYSLFEDVFSLNTLAGRAKMPFHREGMEKFFQEKWMFGTATLISKHGKYYLHVPATIKVPCSCEIRDIVGLDRGLNFLLTGYDSEGKTFFVNGREIKDKRSHFKELRQSLQKKGTPSSRRRLKAIGRREHRWMQDVNHCVSKALIQRYPKHTLFVLEDLSGIRSALEKVKRKDRYVMVSWAFYDLAQKIKYKAALNECIVKEVDPRYTSQRCPKCGHIERTNRDKKTHTFKCKSCGYTSNDDRVAAMNLQSMGRELVPFVVLGEQASPDRGMCQLSHDATPEAAKVAVAPSGEKGGDTSVSPAHPGSGKLAPFRV